MCHRDLRVARERQLAQASQQHKVAAGASGARREVRAGTAGPTLAAADGKAEEAWKASSGSPLPLPVWWMAPFFDNSGFGKEAASLVLSLIR